MTSVGFPAFGSAPAAPVASEVFDNFGNPVPLIGVDEARALMRNRRRSMSRARDPWTMAQARLGYEDAQRSLEAARAEEARLVRLFMLHA